MGSEETQSGSSSPQSPNLEKQGSGLTWSMFGPSEFALSRYVTRFLTNCCYVTVKLTQFSDISKKRKRSNIMTNQSHVTCRQRTLRSNGQRLPVLVCSLPTTSCKRSCSAMATPVVRVLPFPLVGSSRFSHRVRLKRVVRSPTLYPPYYEPLDPFFPRFITLFFILRPVLLYSR